MGRNSTQYVCQECGSTANKWAGKCESCNAWNSMTEETMASSVPKGLGTKRGRKIEFVGLKGTGKKIPRCIIGISELDRVTGGGLVPGSALLVGGDPGIGKSTLLLQATAAFSKNAESVYISGEESIDQLRLRAERLGLAEAPVRLAAATSVRDIVASLEDTNPPGLVVIDSIQTMFIDNLDSAPGTVSQVRASSQELIRVAKQRGFTLVLVGHVTKEGQIAGPRVLEHMVDTVLYFEGERGHQFRILRAVKNRFGPTDEIGVFEMTDGGLSEVNNPSELFLSERSAEISGACVFAGMEGTRPMLVEFQSLLASSALGTPRRAVVGWDSGRLATVMAVLETRCGMIIAGNDVYLSVAGGLRVAEPAADMAVAAALASSARNVPISSDTVIFGEIGLSGEVRAVSQTDNRLREAEKLGFTQAIIPKRRGKTQRGATDFKIREIGHLSELLDIFQSQEKDTTSYTTDAGTAHYG